MKKKTKKDPQHIFFCILADKANLSTNYEKLVQLSNGYGGTPKIFFVTFLLIFKVEKCTERRGIEKS